MPLKNKTAEVATIAAIKSNPKVIVDMLIRGGYTPEYFATEEFSKYFLAAASIYWSNKDITASNIKAHLEDMFHDGKISKEELQSLKNVSPDESVNWSDYEDTLKSYHSLRRAEGAIGTYDSSVKSSPLKVHSELVTLAGSIASILGGANIEDPRPDVILSEALDTTQGAISSGLATIDDMLHGGFRNGELTVYGAPVAHGKSVMCATIASNMVRDEQPVIVFSMEMPRLFVIYRILCSLAWLNWELVAKNAKRNSEEQKRWDTAVNQISKYLRVYRAARTVDEIATRINWHKTEFDKTPMVMIDHIDRMQGNVKIQGNTPAYLMDLSYSVSDFLAAGLEVPVLAFAQFSAGQQKELKEAKYLADPNYYGSMGIKASASFAFVSVKLESLQQKVMLVKDRIHGALKEGVLKFDPWHFLYTDNLGGTKEYREGGGGSNHGGIESDTKRDGTSGEGDIPF